MEKTRSGFVEGKCPICGKMRFSKGNVHKHKCKGTPKKNTQGQRINP